MKYRILIFSILLSTLHFLNVSNASSIIDTLRKTTPANETLLKKAIENTLEFLKHHIYYAVSSDPPQPDFDNSYFQKVDYSKIFNNIKTENTNYFDFKNEFISAIYKLNDLHTIPFFGQISLFYYIYICPIILRAEYDKENNKAKMYGDLALPEEYYNYFQNGPEVLKKIKENNNTEIISIKDKNPFTFISEFAGIKLKNKHSTYVYNQLTYLINSFLFVPATLEDLTDFTVIYSNNENFTTEYIVLDIREQNNNIKFYQDDKDNIKFVEYLSDYYKNFNSLDSNDIFYSTFPFKSFLDIIKEYEQTNNIKSSNLLFPSIKPIQFDEIIWDYNFTSMGRRRRRNRNNVVFLCRVDKKNKVNVLKINNFGGIRDSETSLEVAEKCARLFDENEFKIVIIIPRNLGGNPIVGYNIIELLSPYILTRNTLRIKRDKNMDKFINLFNRLELFAEFNSTKGVNPDYFKDGFVSEKYGDKTEEFSKPFSWKINQKRIEEIKSKLKHKRTPTDIIVLTDGLGANAASIFLKNIYKSGAGIVTGYNGNPNLPDEIFDISQSASAPLILGGYREIYPEIYQNTIYYLIGLFSLTCFATYHEYQDSYIPQEYDVQIPDQRIKIFKPYDDIYYQEFITEAINVLDSYKENCNPENKMLVLLSDKCKFDNKQLHGGFGCGYDSKWNTSNCIPVYCDSGFYYNKASNTCIKYPIEGRKIWWIILVSVLGFLILAGGITTIILYKKKLLCFKKKEIIIDDGDNYNINNDLLSE